MLLTIHDAHLRQVASIDNDKQGTLNYFNDTWASYLETGAATFDFTVSKKELATDTYSKRAYQFLNEKNFISFEYEGETQLFIVRKVVENEKLIKLNCVNLNLELINEYANPYKALKDMSFEEYCKALDLLNFTMLKIGVNEISDKKLTLEWEGKETKLARLLSLANKFGAEIEFKTFLNSNSSIKAFVVNVYHANDGFHQGVGKRQSKVLRYGRDFNSLTRTVDTTGIYNAILPTGNRSEVTSTKTSVIHNVDGSVTTTKKVRNPDGSVTTTSKRVRNDGFVLGQVVTMTVKNPDGTSSTTTEREMTTVYKKRTGRRKKAEEQPPFKVKHSKTSKTSAYSNDSTFDLADLPDWKLENENGQVEFYKAGKMLYAPLSMQMFPAAFTSDTMNDQWIRRDATIDAETQEELSDKALDMLRKSCYPAVTYEVDGYLPYGVGDTVEIEDDGFALTLLLEMRVSERSISFTGTGTNKSVFANFKALENQLSSGIQQRLEEMLEEAKPYDIKVASDNGTVFKNNKGKSTIYPTLLKGEKTIPDSEVSWKWKVDERDFPLAPTFTVEAAGLTKPLTVTIIAIVNGKEVAHKELAFTNVNDGAKGSDGKSITVAKAEKQADGVKVTFSDNKSIVVPKGDKGDKGDPADPVPLNALQEEMKQTKQGLSDVKTDLLKEKAESSANIERVKKEVGAISSQQTAYEQSNTENLARITGQLGDKASKSEIKQTADGIREEMSQLSKNADEKISAAKTTFEKTAEGLKTDMVAVKSYVANDGKRREELEQYSREETAKQIASERSAVAQNYVGKSQYTEDVKGVNRRFEELRTGTSNLLLNTEFKTLADVNNVNGATLKLNQNDYNSHNSIEVTVTGQNKNVWKGITLNASVSAFKKGDTIAVRMPIYIFSDVPINAGLTLVLKNRSKNIAYVFKGLGGLPRNKWHIVELLHTFNSDANFEGVNFFYLYATQNGHYKIAEPSLTLSNVIPSSWAPAVEDSKNYTDTKLAEYKQGVDGQFAAVKQEVGSKVSQATFDQRANQITQSVQELNNNTVKKNQIKIDENGLVSSSEKIVNGQTLASMISQNPEWVEIIAKLLKIKADMIVNGAITADKLNVEKLGALASDLGKITAGEIEFTTRFRNSPSHDVWGTVPGEYNYDATVLINSGGIYSNGKIGRKNEEDKTPTITPVSYFKNGELFFANLEAGHSLKYMQINGIHPFIQGGSSLMYFGKKEDGKDALYITCHNAELYLKSDNYTDWKQSAFNSGVRWKVQGNLILVDYDVTFNKDGNQAICGVPQEYVAGARMFVVKAWSLNKDKDRTAQLNADGSLHILGAEKGMNYRGQIIWAY
ncbi:phage tail protein [Streptococcus anginosus]|uniref:phage tail protein n=1 Tax=Streptococcus anginosus TaxID=1328 RepID=UPI002FEF102A